MKKFLSILIVFFLLSGTATIASDYEINGEHLLQDSTLCLEIVNFLIALKNGDVGAIKKYIPESFYELNRNLFENNKEYPNFLKNYYKGTKFTIQNTKLDKGNILADIVIRFPNGHSSTTRVAFIRTNEGKLKEIKGLIDRY